MLESCAKVFKLPCSELSPIIGDNVVGHAKLVHDLSDEFHLLSHCTGGCRIYFDPF
jgi:hypothetical protein